MKKTLVYEKMVTIPTYRAGSLEKNPLFIEKRAYQGSTGKVYPLPICEKISDTREEINCGARLPSSSSKRLRIFSLSKMEFIS